MWSLAHEPQIDTSLKNKPDLVEQIVIVKNTTDFSNYKMYAIFLICICPHLTILWRSKPAGCLVGLDNWCIKHVHLLHCITPSCHLCPVLAALFPTFPQPWTRPIATVRHQSHTALWPLVVFPKGS